MIFQFDTFIVNLSLHYYSLQNVNILLLRHLHSSSQFFVRKASEKCREAEENMRRAEIMMRIISKHATGHKYHDEDAITKAFEMRIQLVIVKYYSETQHNED